MKSISTCVLFLLLTFFTNSEAQWVKQLGGSFNAINLVDQNYGFALSGTLLYRTTDGGNSWNAFSTTKAFFKIQFVNHDIGFGMIRNVWVPALSKSVSQIYKTTNGGITWTLIHQLDTPEANDFFFLNENFGWACYNVLYQTKDGGKTWTNIFSIDGSIRSIFLKDELNGWIFTNRSDHYYNTTDGGNSWQSKSYPYMSVMNFISKDSGFASGSPIFSRTTDGGNSWIIIPQSENASIAYTREMKFFNQSNGFLLDDYYHYWETEDGGNNWVNIPSPADNTYLIPSISAIDKKNIWLANLTGIYKREYTPSLKITQPNGGDTLYSDFHYEIEWTYANLGAKLVELDYSIDDGLNWTKIADSIKIEDKKYKWNLPHLQNSDKCLIRIKEMSQGYSDTSDSVFSIIQETRKLTFTYPKGGEILRTNSNVNIFWKANYNTNSNIGFVFDPVDFYPTPTVPIKDTTCLIHIPGYQQIYTLKIFDVDNPQIYTVSAPFSVKFWPNFSIAQPSGHEVWQADSIRIIKFESVNVEKIKLEYSIDSCKTWITVESSIQSDSNNIKSFSYNWKIPNTPSKKCFIKMISLDNSSVYKISPQFEITNKEVLGYFPLAIGNKWYYDFINYTSYPGGGTTTTKMQSIWEVADTVRDINRTKYYLVKLLEKRNDNTYKLADTILINVNKNNVNIIGPFDPLNFSMSFADYTRYNLFDNKNLFDKQLHSFCVYDDHNENHFHWVTDSIGVTNYNCADLIKGGYGMYLVGCVLDGNKYGEILENYLVNVQNNNFIHVSFYLSQNYPNPFNPTTTIKYQLPITEHVTLKVYDMLGREAATLVNEEKAPGNYEVKFDGSNLSSGVYFYRMEAGNFSQTKKLIQMK